MVDISTFPYVVDAERPGDLFSQLAKLCGLIEADEVRPGMEVIAFEEGLFIDYRLLDCFKSIRFVLIPAQPLAEVRRRFKLPNRPRSENPFGRGAGEFRHDLLARALRSRWPRRLSGEGAPFPRIDIFISLEIEKRVWSNQVELLEWSIRELSRTGRKIRLVNNGMTQSHIGSGKDFRVLQRMHENAVLEKLSLATGCEFIDLFGLNFDEKMPFLAGCHVAVGPVGTGSMLSNALQIPTVSAGNSYLHGEAIRQGFQGLNPNEKLIPLAETTEFLQESLFIDKNYKIKSQLKSYSTDSETYKAAVESIYRAQDFVVR